jgi:uncharacterized protein (DUF1697 family)
MTTYVALLRGLNVGKSKRVHMIDLQKAFQELHLDQVRTYIQSGNILFLSGENEEGLLELIEEHLMRRFGFHIQTILRTAAEIRELVDRNPYSLEHAGTAEDGPAEFLHVALLARPPQPWALGDLEPFVGRGESYHVVGREVYLWLPNGIARSKLASSLERLGAPFTVRNWRTISALNDLMHR